MRCVGDSEVRFLSCQFLSNVLRLGDGCLTDAQFSHGISMAAFAKPLLCAGRFISTKFNLKTK